MSDRPSVGRQKHGCRYKRSRKNGESFIMPERDALRLWLLQFYSLSIFVYLQVSKCITKHPKHITTEELDALLSTNLIYSNQLFNRALCTTYHIKFFKKCVWFVSHIFRISCNLYHGIELLGSTQRSLCPLGGEKKLVSKNI